MDGPKRGSKMNHTLLALLTVLSIYGLTSLTFSPSESDAQDDLSDVQIGDQLQPPSVPPDRDEIG